MDRSIGGSRFHCGCAVVSLAPGGPGTGRRAAGPRRTNNRGMRRGVRWGGRSPICVFNPWSHSILRAKIRLASSVTPPTIPGHFHG